MNTREQNQDKVRRLIAKHASEFPPPPLPPAPMTATESDVWADTFDPIADTSGERAIPSFGSCPPVPMVMRLTPYEALTLQNYILAGPFLTEAEANAACSEPGPTCPEAATLSLETTRSGSYPGGLEFYGQWWRVDDLTVGDPYHVTISGVAGGSTVNVYDGTCDNLHNIFSDVADGCYDIAPATSSIWVYIAGQENDPGTYTVGVFAGSCP